MTSLAKLHEKWQKNREESRKNAERVKQRLLKEGTLLFLKYGIETAVIFGSLVDERQTPMSDIDLFVRSLPNEQFFITCCLMNFIPFATSFGTRMHLNWIGKESSWLQENC